MHVPLEPLSPQPQNIIATGLISGPTPRERVASTILSPMMKTDIRHWKATMLYHQTKDIIYVQRFLGHKKIENTMLYIQIAENLFKEATDEFSVKVANKQEEIKSLLEVGFEYVCGKDGLLYFRKRK